MKLNVKYLLPANSLVFSLLLTTSLITGCASAPKQMVLAPQLMLNKSNLLANKLAQVSVNDLRNKIHIIEILQPDAAAQLINSASNISQVVNQHFSEALTQHGLTISPATDNHITLIINNAEITVQQALLKYTTKGQITLTAKVQSGDQVLTKTYNSKMNSEGPLKADLAVLERDFNQQLAKLLVQIASDSQIKQFLR
ncbi:hypothetical protein tinsulaeT_29470 [Thalassotalea insulae]|uniref:Lipoprotein n=1 Tax=Thalassotalea insulae TaxID=2056778 RepID=A0ABQ6GYD4_9GAMM|nr:YajG family lipoprotein [Thalassotalea insulae]GLX79607.1 hypothetical protein tinsulaeT_29470 [Thalassotalea insulae]